MGRHHGYFVQFSHVAVAGLAIEKPARSPASPTVCRDNDLAGLQHMGHALRIVEEIIGMGVSVGPIDALGHPDRFVRPQPADGIFLRRGLRLVVAYRARDRPTAGAPSHSTAADAWSGVAPCLPGRG